MGSSELVGLFQAFQGSALGMDTGREPGGGGEKPPPSSETRRDQGDPGVRSTQNNLQRGPLVFSATAIACLGCARARSVSHGRH